MVNTPETTGGKNECYGANAVTFNTDLVLGKTVELRYDIECQDQFGRTLAYVTVDGQEVNTLIVERGYALRAPHPAERRRPRSTSSRRSRTPPRPRSAACGARATRSRATEGRMRADPDATSC